MGCGGPKALGAEGLCVWGGVLIGIQECCVYGNEVVSIGEAVCEGERWSEGYMVMGPQQVWGAVWMRMSVYLGGVCGEGFLLAHKCWSDASVGKEIRFWGVCVCGEEYSTRGGSLFGRECLSCLRMSRGDEVNLRENVGQKLWETVYVGRDCQ